MKKIWALIFIIIISVFCVACGSDKKDSDNSSLNSVNSDVPVEPISTPTPMVKIVVVKGANDGLNIRKEASSAGEILKLAQNGDKFVLVTEGKVGGWHEIMLGEQHVFISADYASVQEISADEIDSLNNVISTNTSPSPIPSATSTPDTNSASEVSDNSDTSQASEASEAASPTPTATALTPSRQPDDPER